MGQQKLFNDLLEILEKDLIVLNDKSEENPHNTLYALWHLATDNRLSPILAKKLDIPILTLAQILILEESVKSRLSGVPLAHLTERQHFMGIEYILDRGLYIPRKETELLARTAINSVINDFDSDENVNVIDLCTGIGTVALAIAHYCCNTKVFGSDIYEAAIIAAKRNAKHFSLEERSSFYHGNLFDPFDPQLFINTTQIIVSAPPYISTAKVKQMNVEISNHEPEEAFDAGPFGLSIFSKLISMAPDYLCTNGYLIFECGVGQGEFLKKRITDNSHYGEITEVHDENGNIRVLKAKKVD